MNEYYSEERRARLPETPAAERSIGKGLVYLPHQCDEWIIGNEEDVLALITDLVNLLRSGQVRRS